MDLKYSLGGFVDFEFTVQLEILKNQWPISSAHTLDMLDVLAEKDSDWRASKDVLREHFLFMRHAEQLHQISSSESGSVLMENSEGFQSVADLFQITSQELKTRIMTSLLENSERLKRLDPRRRG